jgi:transglutaminase-like putative cysteine protease
MGSGSSRIRQSRVTPAQYTENKASTRTEIDVSVVPPIATQSVSTQTSTLDLRATQLTTIETKIKLLSEIKLVPDRNRTISEYDRSNPRKDLITNQEYRQHIDKNCSKVNSIAELVDKIECYSQKDVVRVWLIFYWITKHITYVGGRADNAADAVFRTRTGVCRGFTHLFSECCRLLGIECVDVPGYVKENWFRIGDTLQQATHVWNAVKLNGHWYLLDATWGAGSEKEKKLEEFYFLTSPDQMIYTHLPTEDMWQLLSPPITKQQFLDLPLVKSTYYRLNLKLISPKQCVTETNQPLFQVLVKTPSLNVTLTTKMKVGEDEYLDFHQLCQYDHTDAMTRCYFSPTNDGKTISLLWFFFNIENIEISHSFINLF